MAGQCRILVVEDFERWRHSVALLLGKNPEMLIVAEATDGLTAVEKAQELHPDLILLDIGLPKLNGFEAARRIREVSPNSKIIFLTQNLSGDLADEALRIGAFGYVLKSDAASELLPAIEAVLKGQQFISESLRGVDRSDVVEIPSTNQHIRRLFSEPLPPNNIKIRHEVEFYPHDGAFVDSLTRVVEAALNVGNVAIVVANEHHRAGIDQKLREGDVDIDAAISQGRYLQVDALETLSRVMRNDLPDPGLCAKTVGDLITRIAKNARGKHSRIAFCGECAPMLLANGNVEGAVRLEHIWDEVTSAYDADTLCGYLSSAFSRDTSLAFEQICAEHSAIHGRQLGY